ncbi:unnamed protein product, partial [Ectocarpus sp. 8 AP-2014]
PNRWTSSRTTSRCPFSAAASSGRLSPSYAAGKKQSVSAAAGALTCTISLPGWDTVSV